MLSVSKNFTSPEACVLPEELLLTVIERLDRNSVKIILVVDRQMHLLGTVTDGDIRRAILKGVSLQEKVQVIMNQNPRVANKGESIESIQIRMKKSGIHAMPILDRERVLVGLEMLEKPISSVESLNPVVLMAGGMGKRLYPLTENCPKPMLPVGNKPILETVIKNFTDSGFKKFYIAVNYLNNMIEDYFGDGSKFDCRIEYIKEKERLGTAGALAMLPSGQNHPFIIMNGDVLTKVDFSQLIKFHEENKAQATMCVREYDFQVPYGVVQLNNHKITEIDEKPVQRFFVNAGIYVLNPNTLQLIKSQTRLDMTDFFSLLIAQSVPTSAFPIREYWVDVGRLDDLEKAETEYKKIFL